MVVDMSGDGDELLVVIGDDVVDQEQLTSTTISTIT